MPKTVPTHVLVSACADDIVAPSHVLTDTRAHDDRCDE